jgi:hypothetical protein
MDRSGAATRAGDAPNAQYNALARKGRGGRRNQGALLGFYPGCNADSRLLHWIAFQGTVRAAWP